MRKDLFYREERAAYSLDLKERVLLNSFLRRFLHEDLDGLRLVQTANPGVEMWRLEKIY